MKLRSKLFGLYVLFVGLYSVMLLIAPPPRVTLDQYHLTVTQLRLLDLTIIIPLAIIWFIAFYGFSKLRTYATLIRNSKDGTQINKIANGIMVLTIGLPFSSVIGSIMTVIAQDNPEFRPASIIVRHYLDLLVPLIAFSIISIGARGLADLAKHRPPQRVMNIIALVFITIGVFYCHFVLTAKNFHTAYYLPEALVLLTIVIPYMYTWYLGLLSAYQVHAYSLQAPGIVYRRNWDLFAYGIAATILTSVVFQYVTTLSKQFSSLHLLPLLGIVYGLLALMSVGYALIALGAKKLQKIEEV